MGIVLRPRGSERHGPWRMNNIYLRWLFIMCFFVNRLIFPYPQKSHSIIFMILNLSSFFLPTIFQCFSVQFQEDHKTTASTPIPLCYYFNICIFFSSYFLIITFSVSSGAWAGWCDNPKAGKGLNLDTNRLKKTN